MLSQLSVHDFAIVDNLELELGSGMTVLTGETGAGKSLLVDAVNLALGERASADLVRGGCAAAEVNVGFEPEDRARQWLDQHALSTPENACLLRRRVGTDGRSRAFINGRPVPVGQLRELGECLLDVHGQHAHQSLLKADAQRALLDGYGSHEALRVRVADAYQRLRAIARDIEQLQAGQDDAATRLDYLQFQLSELDALALEPGEVERIAAEQRRLGHATELLAAAARAAADLGDDEYGAANRLRRALRSVADVARLDPRLGEVVGVLEQALSVVSEGQVTLRRYADGLDVDEGRLLELERSLARLQDLARKHRCSPEQLAERREQLRDQATRLRDDARRLREARAARAGALDDYAVAAAALSAARIEAASGLQAAVNALLGELGMSGARVELRVEPADGSDGRREPARHGNDRVSLLAATNPGQPPRALARVASGGELSRLALAIQSVASADSGVPTVIFDEVDAGIGGAVAEIVGRRMHALASQRQVLTVTHLPQIAACAHHHVVVNKIHTSDGVRTALEVLDHESRVRELARMLGGLAVTEKTLAHAREMLGGGDDDLPRRPRRPAA